MSESPYILKSENRDKIQEIVDNSFKTDRVSSKIKNVFYELENEFSRRYADYLKDEFSLVIDEIVLDEVKKHVSLLIEGDEATLSKYLCVGFDARKLMQSLVNKNKEWIINQKIEDLQDQVKDKIEQLKWYHRRDL